MRKGYVYYLWDKDEKDIFYVGSTINPEKRLKAHNEVRSIYDFNKEEYIQIKPRTAYGMSILEEIDFSQREELLKLEVYWIQQISCWGFTLKNDFYYRGKKAHPIKLDIAKLPTNLFYYVISVQNKIYAVSGITYSRADTILWIIKDYNLKSENKFDMGSEKTYYRDNIICIIREHKQMKENKK